MTPCGTRTAYNEGCRCEACRRVKAVYEKRRRYLRAKGVPATVPFDTFHALIGRLNARGLANHAIALNAGLSSNTVNSALQRRRPVLASTYQAVAALGEPAAGYVPADLTRRRIRSLQRAGWPLREIEARAGVDVASGKWRDSRRVQARFAGAVRDVYRQLNHLPGPSPESAGKGKAAGWPPPAEWDDPDTLAWPDGHAPVEAAPEPVVDVVAVDRFLAGDGTIRLSLDEKREAIRRAPLFGVHHNELMRRWKWSGTTFSRHRAIALDEDVAA